MIDLLSILKALRKRKWFVAGIVAFSTGIALLLSALMPKLYLSETSVLPANAQLNDKSRFFSKNIQELISGFGTADDLDRLYATAKSGLVYNAMVDSFKLINYYDLKGKGAGARDAAIRKLKDHSYLLKSEYGELKIGVWDRDPNLAASIANAFIDKVQKVNESMFSEFYRNSLNKLEAAEKSLDNSIKTLASDSQSRPDSADLKLDLSSSINELNNYRSIISEYKVAMLNPPPSLIVLEKANPTLKADKPNIWLNTIAAFLASGFVAVLLSVLITKKE